MIAAGRIAAAIEVLDRILAGQPAELALTNWGRGHRFAGSGDRSAIRDHVFDALRCKRSFAVRGGAESGRGLMLGALREAGEDPATLFTGQGHAPAVLSEAELSAGRPDGLVALDCPEWLAPQLQSALGEDFGPVMQAMRHRAPVFLRVNLARISRVAVMDLLAQDGIEAAPHPLADAALKVVRGARKIQSGQCYAQGFVELQDASSQAVVEVLPLSDGMRVLDYCAGGGGKTLAMAARARLELQAHDAEPRRMADLPARAARAGVMVQLVTRPVGPYDLVLADVPCSGSGSWRRDPQGKWALTPERLAALQDVQAGILAQIAPLVAPGGVLAYATCSMLSEENEAQIDRFLARHPGWQAPLQRRFSPLQGGDGFFVALLTRKPLNSTQL